MVKGPKCAKCNRVMKADLSNSTPAPGVAGRMHMLGFGCNKRKEAKVVVVAKATKPVVMTLELQGLAFRRNFGAPPSPQPATDGSFKLYNCGLIWKPRDMKDVVIVPSGNAWNPRRPKVLAQMAKAS